MVSLVNDWQKERQFQVLNDKKAEHGVKVIRNRIKTIINVHKVVVGDLILLEPGGIISCNGVFLSGHNVKCDKPGATGKSDMIKKVSYEDMKNAWFRTRLERREPVEGTLVIEIGLW